MGGKSHIRNDMMTGSFDEPSQNVIASERSEPRDLWVASVAFSYPTSEESRSLNSDRA